MPIQPASRQVAFTDWQPEIGDTFVVDTLDNIGYLVHLDGRYLKFDVITGQRRTLHYIGRTYWGATPERDWVVQSKEIKGDRWTFGPTGRFLRLYWDDEDTAYGIHEHKAEDVMFARDIRYQSMGCVIVTSRTLDLIEKTYDINEVHGLPVYTRYGIEDDEAAVQIAHAIDLGVRESTL